MRETAAVRRLLSEDTKAGGGLPYMPSLHYRIRNSRENQLLCVRSIADNHIISQSMADRDGNIDHTLIFVGKGLWEAGKSFSRKVTLS